MHQTWQRLLFLHWRHEPEVLQRKLPPGLWIDTFDNAAWVGVVPFFMRNIRLRGLPPIPTATNFLELNLRTYVYDANGTPGVWFFSLDASSRLAVLGGRWWFGLPYWRALMSARIEPDGGEFGRVRFESLRVGAATDRASLFEYAPAGALQEASPGSLEFFLIERYVLFSAKRSGALRQGRVFHSPYRFAAADGPGWDEHLPVLEGLPATGRPPDHAVAAPGVDVEVFRLTPTFGVR